MSRKWLVLLLVMAALLALAGGAPDAQAQSAASAPELPPRVIDIFPLPGVEMALNNTLTITFDQPMNPQSVEAAFSLTPQVTGGFAWSDARTLRFTPDAGWQRSTLYTARIDTDATTAAGVPLAEAVEFEVRTIGALNVAAVSPEADTTGVAADARIVVTFDRPVVPLGSTADQASLPSPLRISPAPEGTGAWLNTSMYVFNPAPRLAGSTTYTVSIAPGLTGVDGALLEQGYQWSFTTLPPEILSVNPASGATTIPLDEAIEVSFSQSMDAASAQAAFSLSVSQQPVEGAFSWNADNTVMTFTPSGRLQMETQYTIDIDGETARSSNGQGVLESGVEQTFTTVPFPRIIETRPSNGETDVYTSRTIDIRFNAPINPNTLEGRILISPEPESWLPVVRDYSPDTLTLSQISLNFDTTYSITILAGVEDVYGNAIANDYSFSFTTEPLRNQAYPVINGDFMITSAYREDTRFAMMVAGSANLDVGLYQIDNVREFGDVRFDNYAEYRSWGSNPYAIDAALAPWATPERLVRAFSDSFSSPDQTTPFPILLASDEGGQLDPGMYWLVIDSDAENPFNAATRHQFALAVATASIVIKRAPEETLLWVTDIATGEPVPNAAVSLFHRFDLVAEGQTDEDGIFRAPVNITDDNEQVYITAEADGVFGAWFSGSDAELPTERGYLYTDRPVYRPGETVYYRGVLRKRRDMDYRIPDETRVNIRIGSPWDEEIIYYEGRAELTEFGTFSGEFVIPQDVQFGDVAITAGFGDGEYYSNYEYMTQNWQQRRSSQVVFTVTEFRVPEFEVSVTAQDESFIVGDTTEILTDARYYAGGAVSSAAATYTIRAVQTYFAYQGAGRYSFADYGRSYDESYFESFTLDTPVMTDANGRALISVGEGIQPPTPRPVEITVDASVSDESNFVVSGRTTVIQHPATVYVGVGKASYFGEVGAPNILNLITVSPDSVPVGSTPITLEIERAEWQRVPIEGQFGSYNWEEVVTPVLTDELVSGADGTATYTFTPEEAGAYRVRATVQDAQGRINRAATRLYILGDTPVFWRPRSNNIEMIADKDVYVPGDTARIIIPLPFEQPSTVLVTAERTDIMQVEVLQAEGASLIYDLPITDRYAPTTYFTVTVLRGTDAENPNPAYASGGLTLNITPVSDLITVEVEASNTVNPPRGAVSFDLRATDVDGNPVQAEIGVALTDKAVLALMPPNSTTLANMFYGFQANYVYTDVALDGLLDVLTDGLFPGGMGGGGMDGGGGGGGGDGLLIREDFEYTPLWAPHVVTDENGEATVSLTLPDNLTTWKLDARAVTMDTEVGQAETEIVSTLPLIVRPVAPRFFVVGDRVALAAVINNNTEEDQTVEARLEATGVTLESPVAQTVTVPAGGRVRVEWLAVAQAVEGVDLTFFAVGDGVQDAAKPALRTGEGDTIPVYRFVAPDVTGTGGILREDGAAVEGVSLPTRYSALDGSLNISLDPSLAAATVDTLTFLENFQHQCTEQTVSRFLPNVVTYRALRDLGLDDETLRENLTNEVSDALTRLASEQKADGGWSWFPSMDESDPNVTAYALLGLIEARAAGFEVDSAMIERALEYVVDRTETVDLSAPSYVLNQQAFFLYVLARADNPAQILIYRTLLDERLRMSYSGRAFLLLAAQAAYPNETAMIDALASDLTSAAILSANGAHWEETERDWWNWTSDTRTTALALAALLRVDAENPLLPNVVRWLMTARRGDHWQTTQESAWSVLALTDWMVATGELEGSYEYIAQVNDELLAQAQVTPSSLREGARYTVSVDDLLTDTVNRLTVSRGEGAGALYYTAYLDLDLPASEVEALDRGVNITREYFLNNSRSSLMDYARVGDVLTVRLTITLTQDMYYFVLEDPIPAGTENLNPGLQTSSIAAASPMLDVFGEDEFWFWRWWLFDRTEQRDSMTTLYADFLPAGTYVYSYQVQAAFPGEFQVMPAHGYAFYLPEVFGRSSGELFTIMPEGTPLG